MVFYSLHKVAIKVSNRRWEEIVKNKFNFIHIARDREIESFVCRDVWGGFFIFPFNSSSRFFHVDCSNVKKKFIALLHRLVTLFPSESKTSQGKRPKKCFNFYGSTQRSNGRPRSSDKVTIKWKFNLQLNAANGPHRRLAGWLQSERGREKSLMTVRRGRRWVKTKDETDGFVVYFGPENDNSRKVGKVNKKEKDDEGQHGWWWKVEQC